MSKLKDLLTERTASSSSKMEKLAKQSSSGGLSSFSGVFKVSPLSSEEKEEIKRLLNDYKKSEDVLPSHLKELLSITSEVKAISAQAILLHGERIHKAQKILTHYRDGAFSAWLMTTYGNRQTPYNFLKYYQFFLLLSHEMKEKAETLPKQALYTLASRKGDLKRKEKIITEYKGEPKALILEKIREKFPLSSQDKRTPALANKVIKNLQALSKEVNKKNFLPTPFQKKEILALLSKIKNKL